MNEVKLGQWKFLPFFLLPFFLTIFNTHSTFATCSTDSNTGVVTCTESASASVTVAEACTLTATTSPAHTATLANGIYSATTTEYASGIGKTTLKVVCNDASGFSIYAVGYTNNEYGNTKLMSNEQDATAPIINTGTQDSGNTSAWSMKLSSVTGTYAPTLDNSFGSYHSVPSTYTRVAYRASGTDAGSNPTGSSVDTTYAAFISPTQPAGTYVGKVKYTLIHPYINTPKDGPIDCPINSICYGPNANDVEGTMGVQRKRGNGDSSYVYSNTKVTLIASNFSRKGYGFAGWSESQNAATDPTAKIYGPNETITTGDVSTKGMSLYAVWIPSAGNLQGWSGCNSMQAATYSENPEDETDWTITASISNLIALTDTRDNQTYAVAKLTDGRCWMIENLRLDNQAILTTTNTNNPLNDGDPTNPTVTLKHNYIDTGTFTNISPNSTLAYDVNTAPEGWCNDASANCCNQSRLRTDNTTDRAIDPAIDTESLYGYGNYYNWYSVTAGNGTYDKYGGKTSGDLCPAGWHLPTGHSATGTTSGEFGNLSNSLGGAEDENDVAQNMQNSTNTPDGSIMSKRLNHFPNNLLYSGNISGDSVVSRSIGASYWTSTSANYANAYHLQFNSANVYPGTSRVYKYFGFTARCVADQTP